MAPALRAEGAKLSMHRYRAEDREKKRDICCRREMKPLLWLFVAYPVNMNERNEV